MFVDRALIEVHAGRGGDGKISFRREKCEPRGGPDGGDGGDGGSVLLRTTKNRPTLAAIARRTIYRALDGRPGRSSKMAGRNAKDVVLEVPTGTLVYHAATHALVADLTEPDQELVVARGGKGGRGNPSFATATNQVPRVATHGGKGETAQFVLELKLLADVGLVGLPNAGKSTFLRRVSRARPKVAAYPFTTLKPYLGVVPFAVDDEIVIADLPGLIEGAHEGTGLGHEFLRHVERCRVLLHLVDGTGGEALGTPSPVEAYEVIRAEIEAYSKDLARKPELVALNKIDALDRETIERVARDLTAVSGAPVHRISGVSGEGVQRVLLELKERVARLESDEPRPSRAAAHPEP